MLPHLCGYEETQAQAPPQFAIFRKEKIKQEEKSCEYVFLLIRKTVTLQMILNKGIK